MTSQEPKDKFLPAFFVGVVEEGAIFPAGGLPLHITLFPPVYDVYSQEYRDAIREVVHRQSAFEVTTGDTDMLGPDGTQPVRLLESSVALRSLHEALTSVLVNTSHDPTYRRPYNPHISVESFKQVPKARGIWIGGLSVMKRITDGWQVAEKVGLKGSK